MRHLSLKQFGLVSVALGVTLQATGSRGEAAAAQLTPDVQRSISTAVTKELAAYGGAQPVPGAVVGVWVRDKGEFTKGYGYSNLATHSAMRLDDHFRIGSNTKTFVATVLLQLVDEKKLRLDDTIAHFQLGIAIPNDRQITLRQLAEMRSGIIDAYAVPGVQQESEAVWSRRTPRQWVELAAKQPPLFPPGTKYNYSNTNWFVLGLIIEKVTHDTIQNQIRRAHHRPVGSCPDDVSDDGLGNAGALRAWLLAERRAVGRRVGDSRTVGFVGGGGHDFRHGRYEEMGQSVRDGDDERHGVAEGAANVLADR